jgi:DNA mismatch repair protein MutS2
VLRKRLDAKLNEHLRSARAEVDAVVTRLKQKADALADTASRRATVSTGDVGGLRSEARAALGAIEQAHDLEAGAAAYAAPLDGPPEVGERVLVTTLGAEGIVRDASGKTIEVEIRGKRMRVPQSALRRAAAGAAPRGQARDERRATTHAPVAATEIVLIGVTVDDALDRLEKFLDTALLGDERRLRVVHGHGTGKLRDAVRAFFRQHPLVARVAPAPDNEGGQGATIVELKE